MHPSYTQPLSEEEIAEYAGKTLALDVRTGKVIESVQNYGNAYAELQILLEQSQHRGCVWRMIDGPPVGQPISLTTLALCPTIAGIQIINENEVDDPAYASEISSLDSAFAEFTKNPSVHGQMGGAFLCQIARAIIFGLHRLKKSQAETLSNTFTAIADTMDANAQTIPDETFDGELAGLSAQMRWYALQMHILHQ